MESKWTKEKALSELDELAKCTVALASQRRFSADHTRWTARTSAFLEEVFGRNSRYYQTFSNFTWEKTGSLVFGGPGDPEGSWNPGKAIERIHQEEYRNQLETARGLLLAAKDELERKDLTAVYQGKDTAPESSAIVKIINLAEHKLRKTIRSKPDNEKQVQDAFENLLIGADIDFSRETERIEYSSKTYTPDFTVPKLDLAMEIKLCNRDGREKEMIEEINDDIMAYQVKYGNLMFVVYDLGFIRDIERFSSAFEKNQNVVVRVVKH